MRVLFFTHLREITGTDAAEVDGDQLDEAGVWAVLERRWPGLAAHRSVTRMARNGAYISAEDTFGADDEVALIPPVSGG